MIGVESQEVERKVLSILKIVGESSAPVGARVIAHQLEDHGIVLSERAVRYHLKIMDERGLTKLMGRDGRLITNQGIEELKSALVQDKVGLVLSRIELLAFKTTFDWQTRTGSIPVNVSFFPKDIFERALEAMIPIFEAGLCAGNRVAIAHEGEKIGDLTVPAGKVGMATVCSITVNGTLLKAGVPMDSRFGGILQIRNHEPLRFVELIHYSGSSLDPSEIFIRGKMTSVAKAAQFGEGKILANFREIPTVCRPIAEQVMAGLEEAGLGALALLGNTSESVCEVPSEINRVGMILIGGLNPVAAAEEAGLGAENRAMSTVVNYEHLQNIQTFIK